MKILSYAKKETLKHIVPDKLCPNRAFFVKFKRGKMFWKMHAIMLAVTMLTLFLGGLAIDNGMDRRTELR